jgi:hypothetical protein
MGNFAIARVAALTLAVFSWTGADAATKLPSTAGYTFYVKGQRVGKSDVRITQTQDALRIESKLRVTSGGSLIELSTRTVADPKTYALRSFSYQGTKAGQAASSHVTVLGDSVFGEVAQGEHKTPQARRVTPRPVVVWEDWVMDLEILLALQQAREFKNPMTRGLLLAGSYATAIVTLGFSGEVAVDGSNQSMTARKLLVAIQGGDPFESLIDPERGIPVYIRFPGIGAEVFLNDFYGDNPVSQYPSAPGSTAGK